MKTALRKNARPRRSREQIQLDRQREWVRERARSLDIANVVIRRCLELLRTAAAAKSLLGQGQWTNRYGRTVEFIALAPADEASEWQECLKSQDPYVRPFLHISYEERDEKYVRHCFHNYIISPTQISYPDGSGWYVIDRPSPKLLALLPVFAELNLFLDSLPQLTAEAAHNGRAILRSAENDFDQLLIDSKCG
jgi:hypothetical protein